MTSNKRKTESVYKMTFNKWIKKQKDIWEELENQQNDTREKRCKFFDDRIKCVLGIYRDSKQSYEGMFQDNKDTVKRIKGVSVDFTGEYKEGRKSFDEDIQFGDKEQIFFRKIFEMFPTTKELTLIENNKWEEFDIKDRNDLFDIVIDMLENNDYWLPVEYGSWDWCMQWEGGEYQCKTDELEEKLFFPHMYRIKEKLLRLKGEMIYYQELNKNKLTNREKVFEQDFDRYIAILNDRVVERNFPCRVNEKINKIQQLRCGLPVRPIVTDDAVVEEVITEEDRFFEAGLDRYLNWLDEYKNGIGYAQRIINKIEIIEKMWSIYDVTYGSVQIDKALSTSSLRKTIQEVVLEENKDRRNKYREMGIKMEADCKEDELFEQNLEKYINLFPKERRSEADDFGKMLWEQIKIASKKIRRRDWQIYRSHRYRNRSYRSQNYRYQSCRNQRHRDKNYISRRYRKRRYRNKNYISRRYRNSSYKRIDNK